MQKRRKLKRKFLLRMINSLDLNDEQYFILSKLAKLRQYNSPLVRGVSFDKKGDGISIIVKRTYRTSERDFTLIGKYFDKNLISQIIGESFNKFNGDIWFLFDCGDNTTADITFTRKFNYGNDISLKPQRLYGIAKLQEISRTFKCHPLSFSVGNIPYRSSAKNMVRGK